MDFSKASLQELETKDTNKPFSETNRKDANFILDQLNNHTVTQQQHKKYDIDNFSKTELHFHQHAYKSVPSPHPGESRGDKQTVMSLTYKNLENSEKHVNTENDITSSSKMNIQTEIGVSNIIESSTPANYDYKNKHANNILKYDAEDKIVTNLVENNLELEILNIPNEALNNSSVCSSPNSSNKKTTVNPLKAIEILTTNANAKCLHSPPDQIKNAEKSICRKEIRNNKLVEGLDDAETIEKIAEMIAKSSNESNKNNNPKTKKQLQVLISRNYTEPNWNSCIDYKTSKGRIQDKIQNNEVVSDGNNDWNSEYFAGEQVQIENKEGPEVKFLDKKRFEEIENKLEEMFAGIEDEQLVNTDDSKNVTEKDSEKKNSVTNNMQEVFIDDCNKYDMFTSKSTLPTKAAKKSTESFYHNETEKRNSSSDLKDTTISNRAVFLKALPIPPRRRLSIGDDSELLNLKQKINATDDNLIRENGITSSPLHSEKHKEIQKGASDLPKSKIKNSNQRNCAEYKSEINYVKSNNRNNKKKIGKIEAPCRTKQKQRKIKQRRMQCLLSSEIDNDTEERGHHQTREIESKNRSPFILVKLNGGITVVNTVLADDSNEKYTRSKKASSYVNERKSVKGCHSSTLSNRYDADTADSSWICVFCKKGPHKKGLGDLFGPYIISTDCDEYRSAGDSEKSHKRQRTDESFFTTSDVFLSNKMAKPLNDTVIRSDIQDITGYKDEYSNYSYSSGMSKIADDCYEIWIHEDCAIWAPNIFVIGSRLIGLEDATWNSTRYECVYCSKPGALLCCLQRDCKTTAHVPCAREFGWFLDELMFWAHCKTHVSNKK